MSNNSCKLQRFDTGPNGIPDGYIQVDELVSFCHSGNPDKWTKPKENIQDYMDLYDTDGDGDWNLSGKCHTVDIG